MRFVCSPMIAKTSLRFVVCAKRLAVGTSILPLNTLLKISYASSRSTTVSMSRCALPFVSKYSRNFDPFHAIVSASDKPAAASSPCRATLANAEISSAVFKPGIVAPAVRTPFNALPATSVGSAKTFTAPSMNPERIE